MSIKNIAMLAAVGLTTALSTATVSANSYSAYNGDTAFNRYGHRLNIGYATGPNEAQKEQYTSTGRIVRVLGVKDWSQNSWNNEGQKVYNFTAEIGEQMPESSDFLGKYNYEGNIFVDGMEFRFWSVKR